MSSRFSTSYPHCDAVSRPSLWTVLWRRLPHAPRRSIRRVRLPPRASLQLHLCAGTLLRVEQGRVEVVAPPVWLADSVYFDRYGVDAEGAQALPASGWYLVRVDTEAVVALHGRPGWYALARISRILSCCWGRLARR